MTASQTVRNDETSELIEYELCDTALEYVVRVEEMSKEEVKEHNKQFRSEGSDLRWIEKRDQRDTLYW